MIKEIKQISFFLLAAILTGCGEQEISVIQEDESPVMRTTTGAPEFTIDIQSSALSTATLSATHTYDGDDIKFRGFAYSSTNQKPECNDGEATTLLISSSSAAFSETATNLRANETYYIRAFIYLTDNTIYYSETVEYTPIPVAPSVETMKIFNRVKRAAIVCGHFIQAGNNLRSYGVALNKEGCPTLKDTYIAATDTASDAGYSGIFGVFFDNLEENTMYHVRAYAITQNKDTVYGNERLFKTTQGGSFNWTFNNVEGAKNDGAYERILTHVDSAIYYYRNYTNLNKFFWVNYAPGTPTADCNIDGWMRVGEQSRYQWVGTIQHEMCHGLGVGTASNWSSFGSPWDKPEAVLTLRVMMKDMSMNISHDSQHFWPGGINQQEEVTQGTQNNKKTYTLKQELMLKANALIINAMRNDGLTSY